MYSSLLVRSPGKRGAQHIFTGEKGDYYTIDDGVPQSKDGEFSIAIPG